jgi:hypothetical protein
MNTTNIEMHNFEVNWKVPCQVGEKWRFDDYSYLCKGL